MDAASDDSKTAAQGTGSSGSRSIPAGANAGGIHGALILVSVVEVVAVHLLVSRWSHLAAWFLTALALYGIWWIVSDLRALRRRPSMLDDETLVIRTGVRWRLAVPRDRIVDARRRDWRHEFGKGDGELNLAVTGQPDVIVELDEPATATGPYGITRTGKTVGFSADHPERVVEAILGS